MVPIQHVMPAILAEVLRQAPLTPEKVAFAWRTAVGPTLANATTVALDNHVLRVLARDAAWGREIERSRSIISARLEAVLGAGAVKAIDVRVAPPAAGGPRLPTPRR